MIKHWINGLDGLAGLDMLMAHEDRYGKAEDFKPLVQDHAAWPARLWQRLKRHRSDRQRGRDGAVTDERCSDVSPRD